MARVCLRFSVSLCEHARGGSEPGSTGVIGCAERKKGNLVASPAKLDQTILSSPFPPQTTGTLSALRFVIMSLIRLDSTIKATQMTGKMIIRCL